MKKLHFRTASWLIVATLLLFASVIAQSLPAESKMSPSRPTVFAVLNDGKLLEPIASVVDEELQESAGSGDVIAAKRFGAAFYKPKTKYDLVFGGALDGTVSIVKSKAGSDCGGLLADVTVRPVRGKLNGLVMALATNIAIDRETKPFRRSPSVAERTAIEKIVRSEFMSKGVSDATLRNLKYHNLTALQLDGDVAPEFVGSYWIAPTPVERSVLFFIADQDPQGKMRFGISDYAALKVEDVMSGDMRDVDAGHGAELLLDVLDFDGDGVKEIFTIGRAFEGNNFYVYRRNREKWVKVLETYHYH